MSLGKDRGVETALRMLQNLFDISKNKNTLSDNSALLLKKKTNLSC